MQLQVPTVMLISSQTSSAHSHGFIEHIWVLLRGHFLLIKTLRFTVGWIVR